MPISMPPPRIHSMGDDSRALHHLREAVRSRPNYPEAHSELALLHTTLGNLDAAIFHGQEAVRLNPNYVEAHNNVGNALYKQGKTTEAIYYWREALRIRPKYPPAYNNIGVALQAQGRLEEAEACLREAIRLNPNYAQAYNNLGELLRQQKQDAEGRKCFRTALRLQPSYAAACNNLGALLASEDKLPKAAACFRRASQLRSDFAEPYNNLGNVLLRQGRLDEALSMYEQALTKDQNYAMARVNRALFWLLKGNWRQGWPEYEWRSHVCDATSPCAGLAPAKQARGLSEKPRWDGTALAGRTLLVTVEQGLGDTLQFIRYVPLLEREGSIVVQCVPAMQRFLASCAGVTQLVSQGEQLPHFDVQAPLISLPGLLGATPENVPAEIPYVHAEPALIQNWRKQLAPMTGFKVGIAWQGNPAHAGDRQRSLTLKHFSCLAEVEGVKLISLQKGHGVEQLREGAGQFQILDLGSHVDENAAFMDTAAIMMNLDLVISSDTAVAHLAGALGVPVWLALKFVPDWRWLLDREDTPWYPTMRLFRQKRDRQWQDVLERMVQALKSRQSTPAGL